MLTLISDAAGAEASNGETIGGIASLVSQISRSDTLVSKC